MVLLSLLFAAKAERKRTTVLSPKDLVLDNFEFLEHVGSLLGEQEFVGFIHDIVVA